MIFPDGTERWLHALFDRPEPMVTRSDKPLRSAGVTHRIAASILAARLRYEKSYCYYRGFSRLTETQVGTTGEGNRVRVEKELPDLLGYYLHNRAPHAAYGATRRLDFQLQTHLARRAHPG